MNEDTQIGIAPDAQTLHALAWGDETPTVVDYPAPWCQVRHRAAQIGLGATLVALGIVAVGFVAWWHPSLPATVSAPTTSTTVPAPAVTTVIVPPTVTAPPVTPPTVTVSAPTVTETMPAPAPQQTSTQQDQRFLAVFVSDAGVRITDPAMVISRAHAVCARLRSPDQPTRAQVANEQQTRYNENTWDTCDILVIDAQTVYCPDTKGD
jgi:Protein of unknown function (DUF732)